VNVLVDTSIWSLALRRSRQAAHPAAAELEALLLDGRVAIIGPIRQEILLGIRSIEQFHVLREHLRSFPDIPLDAADYEEAAAFFNKCRSNGIHGSNTDLLICAVAARREIEIFTTDKDFERYAKHVPIGIYKYT
jgi:predicted nucleic acid-binding protein